ncbi:MAG: hypothetical protein WCT77_02535 [Bacteroidota bacterium]|jgi:hypothetical protein
MSALNDLNIFLNIILNLVQKTAKAFLSKKYILSKNFILLIFFSSLIISSCEHAKPRCYDNTTKSLIIRWGEYYKKPDLFKGYQIDALGKLSAIHKTGKDKNYTTEEIGFTNADRYCYARGMLQFLFIRSQTINEPGDTVRFIEYFNPERNSNPRAVWNSRYKTFGSEGHRDAYDSLQALVPKKK